MVRKGFAALGDTASGLEDEVVLEEGIHIALVDLRPEASNERPDPNYGVTLRVYEPVGSD